MRYLYITTFLFILLCAESRAYVFSLTDDGKSLYWNPNLESLTFYINPSNSSGLNQTSVSTIATNSLSQWDDETRLNLNLNYSDETAGNGRNDVYFTSNDLYFSGSGIIGLTLVAYEEETGRIVEADIALNEQFALSTSNLNQYYLGDVLSHEFGHALGMAHSEVQHSTMFFKLTNGQDTLSHDDIAGANAKYPGNAIKGTLSGKIVGKDSETGVFGTHVQAISLESGKVAASTISNIDGRFEIKGLDTSDEYFLYTSPLAMKEHLPNYYFASNKNFCLSNRDYVGSFFQSCLNREEGFPRAVNFGTGYSNDIGNVSIRCSLDSPPRYLLSKGGGQFNLDMLGIEGNGGSGVGNSYVGFFNITELSLGIEDNIKIDLSSFDVPSNVALEEYYLEIKITSQPFYSKLVTETEVEFFDYSSRVYPSSLEVDTDGNPHLDYTLRLPLEKGINSENIFELKIKPKSFQDITMYGVDRDSDGYDDIIPGYVSSTSFAPEDFFPEYTLFSEQRFFYLFSSYIVKRTSTGTYTRYSSRQYYNFDNSECVDAPNAVVLNALSTATAEDEGRSPSSSSDEDNILACGSVSDSGNGSGGAAALLGFMAIFFLFPSRLLKTSMSCL